MLNVQLNALLNEMKQKLYFTSKYGKSFYGGIFMLSVDKNKQDV